MATEHDVRARLRIDDADSTAKLAKFKQGFAGAGQEAKNAQVSASGFLKNVAAQALAFNATAIVRGIGSTASGFVEAAAGADAARRSMAAAAVVLEGVPWEQATEHARVAQSEMAKIGIASGFSGNQVHEAFTAMLEATDGTSASVERTKGELGQVAKIADAFGLSLEAAGREVSFMHEGTLRTRGQLFQLLRSTGIFGADVHKAAEGWERMTDADRTAAIAAGLEQVSRKIENLPPSYQRLVGQVKAVFEGMEKDVGEPIVGALVPALKAIEPKLAQMRVELRQIAAAIGPEIAHWIKDGADLVESGLSYVLKHSEEIRDAIRDGFDHAKAVVEWIIAHKEVLAAIYLAPKVQAGIGAAAALAPAAGALGSAALMGAGRLGMGVGMSAASMGAGPAAAQAAAVIAGLGTLALAAAAAAAALYTIDKVMTERKEVRKGQGGVKEQIEEQAKAGNLGAVQRQIAQMKELDDASAKSRNIFERAWGYFDSTVQTSLGMQKADFDRWANSVVSLSAKVAGETEQLENQAAQGLIAIQQGGPGGVADVVSAYNMAVKLHNDAAAQYAAELLVTSGFTADTLKESGMEVAGGLEAFAELFSHASEGLKAALGDFLGKGAAATAKPPQLNLNGGQTFHIKQDFRDQDPDRVALVFRRDISRLVERRLTARTSSPFGT